MQDAAMPHATLQQTPSAQKLLEQVLLPPGQSSPSASLQLPPLSQALGVMQVTVALVSGWLTRMLLHVPSTPPVFAAAQAWHVPAHAVLQQKPSAHCPLAQLPLPPGHGCPTAALQTPAPSHAFVPMHGVVALVSCWLTVTLLHVPSVPPVFAAAQAWHVPVHAVPQQTPSTHCPLAQLPLPPGHGCPTPALHAPLPSQTLVPTHVVVASVSCWPAVMLPQVPSAPPVLAAEQAWHVPVHAVAQQTPSTHCPLAQLPLPPGHGCPTPALQFPAPSHALGLTQVFAGTLSAIPEGMKPQVPTGPSAHDWHAPQLGTPQQMLSTHWPLAHAALPAQP
jgi:hypothetical protein